MKPTRLIPGLLLLATLIAQAQPVITSQPTNQTVAVGATVNLNVAVNGMAPFGYQWLKDGRFLSRATNNTFSVTKASATSSGVYYVVVTNAAGMVISQPVSVSVGNPDLLGWGDNTHGQLGNGTTTNSDLPISVTSNVVTMAMGSEYSLFVKNDGTLWAMGYNGWGQLGISPLEAYVPVMVTNNVVAVAAGLEHSLFIKNDSTLWAVGSDGEGQLGNGTTINTHLPTMVTSNVVAVAAGEDYSLFVKNDGTLWAMGYNGDGELGNGTTTNSDLPISVASNVVMVAAGTFHSLFVKTDGTLWAMGYNGNGELGNGTTTNSDLPISVASNVVAVAAGAFHSLFVKTDGTLWAMGDNNFGQLGNGTTTNSDLPIDVASNVVMVAAGWGHSMFMENNGTLWMMGDNQYGQLGNGTTIGTNVPTQMFGMSLANVISSEVAYHTLAVGLPQTPVIVQQPSSQAVLLGSHVTFTVAVSGVLPLSYQWYFNGRPLGGATAANYNLIHVMTNNAGNYTMMVTNIAGSVTSSVAALTVVLAPQNLAASLNGTGTGLQLQMSGTPSFPYVLLCATNLAPPMSWLPVVTNLTDTNGNWSFTDTNGSTIPARFYRVMAQ